MHSAEDILNVLDEGARSFVFPMLDNGYVYLAATRLAVFRSAADWAITFEIFGFSPRSGMPDLRVATFGSTICGLRTQADYVNEQAYRAYLVNSANSHAEYFLPIEDDAWIDPEDGELVAQGAREILLRGREVAMPDLGAYARAGVELESPPDIRVFELCRALADIHRDDALATDVERRANLPDDMRQILLLDDWQHPDVVDPDCLPSRSSTFQQLAAVIETGDVGRYGAPPSGNTHWSHWPDGGTL